MIPINSNVFGTEKKETQQTEILSDFYDKTETETETYEVDLLSWDPSFSEW